MHYDADGNLTGWTQAEPEWNDHERDRMLALAVYEAGVCECGFHEDITSDPSNLLTIDSRVCPVCKSVAVHQRKQQAADEKAEKALGQDPPPGAPRPDDGRHEFVRPLTPEEAERAQAHRAREGSPQSATAGALGKPTRRQPSR